MIKRENKSEDTGGRSWQIKNGAKAGVASPLCLLGIKHT